MIRRALAALALAAMTLVSPAHAQQPAATKHEIAISRYGFVPKRLVVRQGDVIAWTNRDAVRHDAMALDRSWASGTIRFGETRTITASKPGTFPYKCSFHPDMRATIVVKPP
jgi:plastocyanin